MNKLFIPAGAIAGILISELALGFFNLPADFQPKDNPDKIYQLIEPVSSLFFKTQKINNEKFKNFTRSNTTSASRIAFTSKKKNGEFRLVVVGESVAEEFGIFLYNSKECFQKYIPDTKITIINAGMAGYTSPMIYSLMPEIISIDPDAVLLMAGNNVHNHKTSLKTWRLLRNPPPFRKLYSLSRVYRILIDRIYSIGEEGTYSIEEFKKDYEGIHRLLNKNNIPAIAFSLPANYADYPPWGYRYPAHLIPTLMTDKGDNRRALKVIGEPGEDAMLWFLKGTALKNIKDYKNAGEAFKKSLNLQPVNRASGYINDFIKETSKKFDAHFIDLNRFFEEISENGMIGDNLMRDNCHWFYSLNPLIAKETFYNLSLIFPELNNNFFAEKTFSVNIYNKIAVSTQNRNVRFPAK